MSLTEAKRKYTCAPMKLGGWGIFPKAGGKRLCRGATQEEAWAALGVR